MSTPNFAMPTKFKPGGTMKIKPSEDLHWKLASEAGRHKKQLGEFVIYCLEQATKHVKLVKPVK